MAGSKPRKIALIYCSDFVPPDGEGPAADLDALDVEASALRALGHEVEVHGISYGNLSLLKKLEADFVFNLCEGNGLDGDPGIEVILALEKRVIPFSGVGSGPYDLTNDKWVMKKVLMAAGVPVPAGIVCSAPAQSIPSLLRYPLFVKPRFGFSSLAIDEHSFVRTHRECKRAVEKVIEVSGVDALVEEYVAGRELTVGIIGHASKHILLPPLEIGFGQMFSGKPLIRTYDTKRNPDSPFFWDFCHVFPAPLDPEVQERVEETALQAYCAVGADGFGRVDIRLSEDGVPVVLEVNGNSSLEEDEDEDEHHCGELPVIARALGWGYAGLLARIIGAGVLRPIRKYPMPRVAMRRTGKAVVSCAALGIAKGTLIAPLGHSVNIDFDDKKGLEPQVRFMQDGQKPNVTVQFSRSNYWLSAARAISQGEEFIFDHRQLSEFAAAEESSDGQTFVPRSQRGRVK